LGLENIEISSLVPEPVTRDINLVEVSTESEEVENLSVIRDNRPQHKGWAPTTAFILSSPLLFPIAPEICVWLPIWVAETFSSKMARLATVENPNQLDETKKSVRQIKNTPKDLIHGQLNGKKPLETGEKVTILAICHVSSSP
jgi:hypothetical protein